MILRESLKSLIGIFGVCERGFNCSIKDVKYVWL